MREGESSFVLSRIFGHILNSSREARLYAANCNQCNMRLMLVWLKSTAERALHYA
jgi:hypothetical protein